MTALNDIKKALTLFNYDENRTQEINMVLDSVEKICAKLSPMAPKFDAEGARFEKGKVILPEGNAEFFKMLADTGILGLIGKEKFGGGEMPVTLYACCMELLAAACPATTVAACIHAACIDMLQSFGTEEAKEKYLPQLISGKKLSGLAFTEAGAGSDLGSAKSTALLDPSGKYFLINGVKQFITSGGMADIFIVMANARPDRGARGHCTFLVDRTEVDKESFQISRLEHKMGLTASPTAEIVFKDCKVPKENMVGNEGEGFKLALIGLDGGRIGVASQASGIAESAYREAIKYAGERVQFGNPIFQLPPIREKLAWMATRIHASRLAYLEAAHLKDQGKEFAIEAAIAKMFASESAEYICRENIKVHGGYGYMKEFNAERHYRDCRITMIYEGTSEIQRLVTARDLLHPRGSHLVQQIENKLASLSASGKFGDIVKDIESGLARLKKSIKTIAENGDKFAKSIFSMSVVNLAAPVYLSVLMLNYTAKTGEKENEARLFISEMTRKTAKLEAEIAGNKAQILSNFKF